MYWYKNTNNVSAHEQHLFKIKINNSKILNKRGQYLQAITTKSSAIYSCNGKVIETIYDDHIDGAADDGDDVVWDDVERHNVWSCVCRYSCLLLHCNWLFSHVSYYAVSGGTLITITIWNDLIDGCASFGTPTDWAMWSGMVSVETYKISFCIFIILGGSLSKEWVHNTNYMIKSLLIRDSLELAYKHITALFHYLLKTH